MDELFIIFAAWQRNFAIIEMQFECNHLSDSLTALLVACRSICPSVHVCALAQFFILYFAHSHPVAKQILMPSLRETIDYGANVIRQIQFAAICMPQLQLNQLQDSTVSRSSSLSLSLSIIACGCCMRNDNGCARCHSNVTKAGCQGWPAG